MQSFTKFAQTKEEQEKIDSENLYPQFIEQVPALIPIAKNITADLLVMDKEGLENQVFEFHEYELQELIYVNTYSIPSFDEDYEIEVFLTKEGDGIKSSRGSTIIGRAVKEEAIEKGTLIVDLFAIKEEVQDKEDFENSFKEEVYLTILHELVHLIDPDLDPDLPEEELELNIEDDSPESLYYDSPSEKKAFLVQFIEEVAPRVLMHELAGTPIEENFSNLLFAIKDYRPFRSFWIGKNPEEQERFFERIFELIYKRKEEYEEEQDREAQDSMDDNLANKWLKEEPLSLSGFESFEQLRQKELKELLKREDEEPFPEEFPSRFAAKSSHKYEIGDFIKAGAFRGIIIGKGNKQGKNLYEIYFPAQKRLPGSKYAIIKYFEEGIEPSAFLLKEETKRNFREFLEEENMLTSQFDQMTKVIPEREASSRLVKVCKILKANLKKYAFEMSLADVLLENISTFDQIVTENLGENFLQDLANRKFSEIITIEEFEILDKALSKALDIPSLKEARARPSLLQTRQSYLPSIVVALEELLPEQKKLIKRYKIEMLSGKGEPFSYTNYATFLSNETLFGNPKMLARYREALQKEMAKEAPSEDEQIIYEQTGRDFEPLEENIDIRDVVNRGSQYYIEMPEIQTRWQNFANRHIETAFRNGMSASRVKRGLEDMLKAFKNQYPNTLVDRLASIARKIRKAQQQEELALEFAKEPYKRPSSQISVVFEDQALNFSSPYKFSMPFLDWRTLQNKLELGVYGGSYNPKAVLREIERVRGLVEFNQLASDSSMEELYQEVLRIKNAKQIIDRLEEMATVAETVGTNLRIINAETF